MYAALATRAALRRATVAPVSRTVVGAQARYSSTEHGNDPEVIEVEKQRNLRKEQHKTSTPIRNAPGWNQYLASASEAAVKADRSDTSPAELAEETLKHVRARHPHQGSSANAEERVDAYEASYEASYEVDNVSGPLKNATPKETTTKFTERIEHTDKL